MSKSDSGSGSKFSPTHCTEIAGMLGKPEFRDRTTLVQCAFGPDALHYVIRYEGKLYDIQIKPVLKREETHGT